MKQRLSPVLGKLLDHLNQGRHKLPHQQNLLNPLLLLGLLLKLLLLHKGSWLVAWLLAWLRRLAFSLWVCVGIRNGTSRRNAVVNRTGRVKL